MQKSSVNRGNRNCKQRRDDSDWQPSSTCKPQVCKHEYNTSIKIEYKIDYLNENKSKVH